MRRPGFDQITPAAIVLRRVCPAGRDPGSREVVAVWRRAGGERLRHEASLDEGNQPGLSYGIEDAVDDRPRIGRPTFGIFAVDAGRAPFQGRGAVARGEQVVHAHMHRRPAHRGKIGQQTPTVRQIGVIRLVVADPVPDRSDRRAAARGVDGEPWAVRFSQRPRPRAGVPRPSGARCRRRRAKALNRAGAWCRRAAGWPARPAPLRPRPPCPSA